MKILFAYFGQPRHALENLPNHLMMLSQMQRDLIAHDPTEIDILYATTPIDKVELFKVKEIIDRTEFNVTFDFISELDRVATAREIKSNMNDCNWSPRTILATLYQPIAIHLLAKKITEQYDAIFLVRTDVLYCTYDRTFDFTYLLHMIKDGIFSTNLYVATMEYRIGVRMTPVHADDKVLLSGHSLIKELFVNDFELNVGNFLDDAWRIWGNYSILHVNDNHATNFWFLVNSHMVEKMAKTDLMYHIMPHRIMPRHEITRKKYKNTSTMTDLQMAEITADKIEFDKNFDKTFKIPTDWFDINGF